MIQYPAEENRGWLLLNLREQSFFTKKGCEFGGGQIFFFLGDQSWEPFHAFGLSGKIMHS